MLAIDYTRTGAYSPKCANIPGPLTQAGWDGRGGCFSLDEISGTMFPRILIFIRVTCLCLNSVQQTRYDLC